MKQEKDIEKISKKNTEKNKGRMENSMFLPEGYDQILEIDLVKNKKLMIGLNVVNLILLLGLLWLGHKHLSILQLLNIREGLMDYLLRLAILVVSIFLYMGLHEKVHGVMIRHYSGRPPHYGYGAGYAYAGSDCYFNRRSYIVIALAPVVVWGVVLEVLCLLLPDRWFWHAYFIQAINLAGAVGDLYVVFKILRQKKNILISDSGTVMTVYGPVEPQNPAATLCENKDRSEGREKKRQ
ncbi:MAG: DUF3267 domain-containing protein [Lachnospiraceae bacterium]|nr:DUF3267 domain-containing protein [Lachnospiraceae bacterium]